jgi:hypothetical protein
MPFTKVVEQYKIYNFSIIHLVHFCSEISSLGISNRAKSNSTGCRRQAFAPTRDVARRGHADRDADRPGATAGALLRPPVPRAPRGKCRGIGRRLHRLSHPPRSRHAYARRAAWPLVSPPHAAAFPCPYLDVRGGA